MARNGERTANHQLLDNAFNTNETQEFQVSGGADAVNHILQMLLYYSSVYEK